MGACIGLAYQEEGGGNLDLTTNYEYVAICMSGVNLEILLINTIYVLFMLYLNLPLPLNAF